MEHKDYRLAVIMFTDIVGFSKMMGEDEAGTLRLMDHHDSLVRESISSHGGKVIKTIGDAFLAEFSNAGNAVRSGVDIQNKLEVFNAGNPPMALVLRIGIHLGDIYFYENDALGEGINIASRLQSICRPGRICLSQEVYNTVAHKLDVPIKAMGQVKLKNIQRDIQAWEVLTNGGAEKSVVPEPAGEDSVPGAGKPAVMPDGAPEMDPEGEKALRTRIFDLIRQKGRRLSLDEARTALAPLPAGGDAVLVRMRDAGFLTIEAPRDSYSSDEGASSRSGGYRSSGPGGLSSSDLGDMAREAGKLAREFADGFKTASRDGQGRNRGRDRPPRDYRYRGKWSRYVDENPEDASGETGSSAPDFDFREVVAVQSRVLSRERAGFRSHLASFLPVNGLLWCIWFFTGAAFPWPLIVSLAWGIGLASHGNGLILKAREQTVLESLPPLDKGAWGLVRKLFRNRRSWMGHLVSTLATGAFLVTLNLITSGHFPWWVFPVAGMGIGLFSHLPGYKKREMELSAALAAEGISLRGYGTSVDARTVEDIRIRNGSGAVGREADACSARIQGLVKGLKGKDPLGPDFRKTLDEYVRQVKVLATRDQETSRLLETVDMGNFDSERERMQRELDAETNPRLQEEYRRTLEQMDAQAKARDDIRSEQKLLQLRIQNAVQGLHRLEFDLARMGSLSHERGTVPGAEEVLKRSSELQTRMDDLRLGWEEAERLEEFTHVDPFEQLMRKAAEEEKVLRKDSE